MTTSNMDPNTNNDQWRPTHVTIPITLWNSTNQHPQTQTDQQNQDDPSTRIQDFHIGNGQGRSEVYKGSELPPYKS